MSCRIAFTVSKRVTIQELMNVEGVDEGIAESVKDTLERVTENTILDQYS